MTRAFKELVLATHNAGKVEEFEQLLAPRGITLQSAADLGLGVPEETEVTFAGNALLKARAALASTGKVALADDSGLEVFALEGAPGVNTADWAETGQGRDFTLAMTRVHDALDQAGAAEPWAARFTCVLAFVTPEGEEHLFEGRVKGRVVWPMRGRVGHGYDPIFQPDGDPRTFAEMTSDEKNALSHRAQAIRRFVGWLDG
jgi:XTP/dITP diphosphohydrolase